MRQGLEVSWLPSYGPEMRSGSAHCHVCLSNERVGSPLISQPDVLIAMNEISLRKFGASVPREGFILYNGAAVPADLGSLPARILCIPASSIADKIGSPKVVNTVLLGALLAMTKGLSPATVLTVLEEKTGKSNLLAANRAAFEAGRQFVDKETLA
jgi:Pyruvate/2-oxoacid:ferredoxin oxidoreductase gamma subunit